MAVPILLRLSGRDPRARVALEQAAATDSDPFVRYVAAAALEGRVRDAQRSRHDLRRKAKTRKAKASGTFEKD